MQSNDKKILKSLAQPLKPCVLIGQAGYTEAVHTEIEAALRHHELVKIKIRADKEDRQDICQRICLATRAELIQAIGQVVVLFRKKPNDSKQSEVSGKRKRPGKPKPRQHALPKNRQSPAARPRTSTAKRALSVNR